MPSNPNYQTKMSSKTTSIKTVTFKCRFIIHKPVILRWMLFGYSREIFYKNVKK